MKPMYLLLALMALAMCMLVGAVILVVRSRVTKYTVRHAGESATFYDRIEAERHILKLACANPHATFVVEEDGVPSIVRTVPAPDGSGVRIHK